MRMVCFSLCVSVEIGTIYATPQVLYEFFESYYPVPSPFELPEGQHNTYRYVEDYRRAQATLSHRTVNAFTRYAYERIMMMMIGTMA